MMSSMKRVSAIAMLLLSACAGSPKPGTVPLKAAPKSPAMGEVEYSLDESLKRGDQAYREARLDDAEAVYLKVLDKHPTLGGVWFRMGNIYLRQMQYDAAIHSYEQAIRFEPADSRAWYNLSLVRLKQSLQTLEYAASRLPVDDPGRQRILALHQQLVDRTVAAAEPTTPTTPTTALAPVSAADGHGPRVASTGSRGAP